MLDLLTQFAALSLISGMVLSLLGDGALRRTASMAVGLMLLLFWARSLAGGITALADLSLSQGNTSPLTTTGVDLSAVTEELLTRMEVTP